MSSLLSAPDLAKLARLALEREEHQTLTPTFVFFCRAPQSHAAAEQALLGLLDLLDLYEPDQSYPLIVETLAPNRQRAFQMVIGLLHHLLLKIEKNAYALTLARWTRPTSDAGEGPLLLAFRFCDLRELL